MYNSSKYKEFQAKHLGTVILVGTWNALMNKGIYEYEWELRHKISDLMTEDGSDFIEQNCTGEEAKNLLSKTLSHLLFIDLDDVEKDLADEFIDFDSVAGFIEYDDDCLEYEAFELKFRYPRLEAFLKENL